VNIFFDVDHTLCFAQELRPGTHEAMRRIKEAGHTIYVWSAGGADYSRRVVDRHELYHWVEACFDKDPRVEPRPDIIIDDDWYLVEKYGGYLVSQYKANDPDDREFADIVERLAEAGHL
jgi:hypothetical protein